MAKYFKAERKGFEEQFREAKLY